MVVCRCRKATKLYCFVHKIPVCGECISSPEHQLCVIKTYSDWVVDGDYDWPPKCGLCQQVLHESDDVTRLGCFHVLHSSCLETHLRSFPPHTAPAGYTCPSCSTPIWPPLLIKEASSGLHSKLKQIISQSGVTTNLLGNDLNALSTAQKTSAPPAFSSSPLVSTAATPAEEDGSTASASGFPLIQTSSLTGGDAPSTGDSKYINESGSFPDAEASSSAGPGTSSLESVPAGPQFTKAGPQSTIQLPNGAMARKNPTRGDSSNISAVEIDDYDDDDGSDRKYSWRGPLHLQLLRSLLPFWSPTLPSLPVTAPSYKRDGPEDAMDGRSRRKQRNSTVVNTRKLLLWFAIMSCMGTVILLYYRLAQGFGSSTTEETAN